MGIPLIAGGLILGGYLTACWYVFRKQKSLIFKPQRFKISSETIPSRDRRKAVSDPIIEEVLTGSEISLPPGAENVVRDTAIDKEKNTVLLVEDNVDLILAIKESLSDTFNILCALNGKEALDQIDSAEVDVVVSDIMMDVMDGYELLEHIRNEPTTRDLPVIFLTARSGDEEEFKGLSKGAIDYVQKPFAIPALKARIANIIEYVEMKKLAFGLEKYRSVGMLSAGICHEIMNPLSGVLGPLYVVERIAKDHGCFDELAFKEGLGYVKDNVKRISNIVETMRTLFHGDSYELQEFDLADFTQTVVDRFRPKIDSQIAIGVSVPDGITISSNRGALTQIFTNLLTNAADSIDGEGTIHIYSDESTGKNIIFRDSGCGIPEDALKKVFDLAFTTKKDNGGTGLGLYIVKELAERLAIGLDVESAVGEGTRFSLRFRDP